MLPADWHKRFLQQAGWTRQAREYLFLLTGLSVGSRILEVGCGTGAVLGEVAPLLETQDRTPDRSFGSPKESQGRALSLPTLRLRVG